MSSPQSCTHSDPRVNSTIPASASLPRPASSREKFRARFGATKTMSGSPLSKNSSIAVAQGVCDRSSSRQRFRTASLRRITACVFSSRIISLEGTPRISHSLNSACRIASGWAPSGSSQNRRSCRRWPTPDRAIPGVARWRRFSLDYVGAAEVAGRRGKASRLRGGFPSRRGSAFPVNSFVFSSCRKSRAQSRGARQLSAPTSAARLARRSG
jgi:hypothetical protein